ncbi:sugar ABC transporter substrate-binding protein [Oribacterium sp. WCC10]|uniref:sugar ABC transporter substrate-binding protein n=1 Tax=Oribacterium sp. WCC10 TaxID=1855343 RepID=UPI0008F04312|nr:substrate-binding domain-containing protein [Oribacterium sp. WCC10]SFG34419.1 monosaccharide ABC transporter substrate-binding protein, CUT2 family [Oribacterium sp. WCC10]
MNEDSEILLPVVVATIVVILFCVVMLIKGTGPEIYKVSVIVSDSNSGRWVPFKAGLEQAANDNNIELNYVHTEYLDNIYTEAEIINEEISRGADGIIAEFCLSDGVDDLVASIGARVPIQFVVTDVIADADVSGNHATVAPDNYAIGRAVGNELVIDYGEKLSDIKIGIISGNQNQLGMQQRLEGFIDSTKKMKPDIVWTVAETRYTREELDKAFANEPADIVIGLDNNSLETAVDRLSGENDGNVKFYGSGCSEKLVYYIDSGKIDSMILPNEFSMGYQSMSDLAIKLQNRTSQLVSKEIDYNVVHRENLFGEDNEQILFPIVK